MLWFLSTATSSTTSDQTFAEWIMNYAGLSSITLPDRVMEYLDGQSIPSGSIQDRMMTWLGNDGYTGSLQDRMAAWSKDNLIQ